MSRNGDIDLPMGGRSTEYEVTLQLELAAGQHDDVVDAAERVLAVVECHARDLALGAVASGRFDPPTVDLDFDVLASSRREVHEIAGRIIELIERHGRVESLVRASVVEKQLV